MVIMAGPIWRLDNVNGAVFVAVVLLVSGCSATPAHRTPGGATHAGYEATRNNAARYDASRYAVIPEPVSLIPGSGMFTIDASTTILVRRGGDARANVAELLGAALAPPGYASLDIQAVDNTGPERHGGESTIVLDVVDATPPDMLGGGSQAEGYELRIGTSAIRIEATDDAGLFYAAQTLLQLARPLPPGGDGSVRLGLPAATIVDTPRFAYRGMHLDVGRHMFPVPFIKRYIALMARYKFNTFHWHLTEDQGWRIEINQYPELTRIGAYRAETILEKNFDPYVGDGKPYGGFYTQDEVRDIVAFAERHHVTIIPEIEMPGHSVAALAAYPELACTAGPFQVRTFWGVSEDIFCPSERTFEFLEDVLSEVIDLFPGEYIHIGGDEAPKKVWRESELAQEVIRREGLADEAELQSYFIRRIESFLSTKGRRLIGWDEILEGGLAPDATVMSWRGTSGGIEAARQGHDVIMTPNSHLYFDHYQGPEASEPLAIGGLSTLEHVYGYDPIPDELSDDQARHILGAQANVWTEYIKTPEHVEYMVLPRMLALAEVVWSPRDRRNLDAFLQKLPTHFDWFDAAGFNYRLPTVRGLEGEQLTLSGDYVLRLGAIADVDVVYTVDGSTPDGSSLAYERPVSLSVDYDGTGVAARTVSRGGHLGPVSRATVRRTSLQPAVMAPQTERGLRYELSVGRVDRVDAIAAMKPTETGVLTTVGLPPDLPEAFAMRLEGFLTVPSDGIYDFRLTSDDGSRLQVGGRVAVDHDGLHGPTSAVGSIALASGSHPLAILFFEAGGGEALRLEYKLRSQQREREEDWRVVPPSWLSHAPGNDR